MVRFLDPGLWALVFAIPAAYALGAAAGTFLGGNRVVGRQEGECPATVELGQVRLVVEYAGAWADGGLSP
jgi:hypothetical protein